MKLLPLPILALLLSAPVLGQPAPEKLSLGVFLPTSMSDGQQRFDFAEKLAGQLTQALGHEVVGRSFGRFEDFSRAVLDGTLHVAVVDAWAAAELSVHLQPLAIAQRGGETQHRWAIVSRSRGVVRDLRGKRLAVTKGIQAIDAKFLTNVVFGGDIDATRYFKLVAVPSVESAFKMVEVKSAESALVPLAMAPKDSVIYRSGRVPSVYIVSIKGDRPEVREALTKLGAIEPFDKFVPAGGSEIEELRKLMTLGPPKRQPVMAESPMARPDAAALISTKEIGLQFPSFIEGMEISAEQPDD